MAFVTTQPRSKDRITEVSMEEFKKWLKQFDGDGDGRIDKEEEAIRATGGWFTKVKARRLLNSVDRNSNGFLDDDEITKLAVFAHKQFGFRIVT